MTSECSRLGQLPLNSPINLDGTLLDEPIREYCVMFDALMFSAASITQNRPINVGASVGVPFRHIGNVGLGFSLPFLSCLPSLALGRPEPALAITLIQTATDAQKAHAPPQVGQTQVNFNVNTYKFLDTYAAIGPFLVFYERYLNDMAGAVSFNWSALERNWAFARVVRNGLVHGGKFNIRDPNFAPVSWRGITITKADDGKNVSGYALSTELILLLIDMHLAMHEIGLAPSL